MTPPDLDAQLGADLAGLPNRLELGDAQEAAGRHEEARRCRDMSLDEWVERGFVVARIRVAGP